MLYQYPSQAGFGRRVPKESLYANARVSASLKKKFVEQAAEIVWAYKLSPETVNLPSRNVPEIEVFRIRLKGGNLDDDVLRCIDNAIPLPIIFELAYNGRICAAAAYKRPSDADKSKWVTDVYVRSEWADESTARTPLPVALDIDKLYEALIRGFLPIGARPGESLREQALRMAELHRLEHAAAKLGARMRKEKQFNRKVEMNAELRKLNKQIVFLTAETPSRREK